jgi:hypothetical protein
MVEKLIALNSALEEANRARSQFLSTMSNDAGSQWLATPPPVEQGFSKVTLLS